MSLPRYPKYKDSGVAWLGEVPEHWESWRVSHAFGAIGSGTTPPSDEPEWYADGTVPWVTTGELRETAIYETTKAVTKAAVTKFSALRIHPAGSLAIAMYGATIGRLGILGVDATTNQACCVLSCPRNLDTRFVFHWLLGFKQNLIDLYATGGGQPNINQEIIASLRIPAPDLSEQTTIATFLDRETAKIDGLIAEQEKLNALLAEKRQATISHAVTKGLNPAAPMKDSGVAWLGEVPAHWETKRLRHVADLNPSKSETASLARDTEVSFLPMEAIGEDGTIALEQTRTLSQVETGYTYFRDGDVTVAKITPCFENGKGAVMRGLLGGIGFGSTELIVSRPRPEHTNSNYLGWIFNFTQFRKRAEGAMYGAGGQKRVPDDFVRNFAMAFPPVAEQSDIATFLDRETTRLDALTTEAAHGIALLKERRSALISAAVTGKIDVREVV